MLKDEKKAVPEYELLKSKALGHQNIKALYDKIIKDEKEHYIINKKIAKELGCLCNDE